MEVDGVQKWRRRRQASTRGENEVEVEVERRHREVPQRIRAAWGLALTPSNTHKSEVIRAIMLDDSPCVLHKRGGGRRAHAVP